MVRASAAAEESPRGDPRERALTAALSLFSTRGYEGTSIPDVLSAAKLSASSLYRVFPSKEALVNAVFREAKNRLHRALTADLDHTSLAASSPRTLFDAFFARLARFTREDPTAFRFLELQDHVPYLDNESRALELAVLTPILVACMDFQRRGVFRADVRPDAMIAMTWGAIVGLVKAERLSYMKLDDAIFDSARDSLWRAFAVTDL